MDRLQAENKVQNSQVKDPHDDNSPSESPLLTSRDNAGIMLSTFKDTSKSSIPSTSIKQEKSDGVEINLESIEPSNKNDGAERGEGSTNGIETIDDIVENTQQRFSSINADDSQEREREVSRDIERESVESINY